MLLVFQAMDAAGKDGTIKHVMSGVNPQGCQVYSFKQPSAEELDHDFLWRHDALPARARPDRHLQPLVLRGGAGRPRASRIPAARSSCPPSSSAKNDLGRAARRHRRLRALPRAQRHRGAQVLPERLGKEQKRRFLERLDEPDKNWKFSAADVKERGTGTTT